VSVYTGKSIKKRRILHVYRMEIQETTKKIHFQMANREVLKTDAAFMISKRGKQALNISVVSFGKKNCNNQKYYLE
jgi:hypothetical protein